MAMAHETGVRSGSSATTGSSNGSNGWSSIERRIPASNHLHRWQDGPMLERFTSGYEHYLRLEKEAGKPPAADSAADDEHAAVLELLVATMYADAMVSEQELDEIDRYGADHGWNTMSFSFVQNLGTATAKVRSAREVEGGLDALLADASNRITSPDVRRTVVAACRLIAEVDGATADAESEWIGTVAAAFGA